MTLKYSFLFPILFLTVVAFGQPEITHKINKKEIKYFFETGAAIDIKRIKYKGAARAIGLFEDDHSIFNMDSGLVMSSGAVKKIGQENKSQGTSSFNWKKGSKQLDKIANTKTKDAAMIEITFVPEKDFISFNFVFGSEEYPEYVKSGFNDAFAFILVSPGNKNTNLAVIPDTEDVIAVNSVNYLKNQEYYVNNSKLQFNLVDDLKIDTSFFWQGNKKYAVVITYNIEAAIMDDPKIPVEFDGFTKLLQAKSAVVPGKRHKLIITIADAGDRIYDSGVLIEAGSFNASADEDFKYGALAFDTNYYYTIDTILVDSIPEEKAVIPPTCSDTLIDLYYNTDDFQLSQDDQEAILAVLESLDKSFQYNVLIESYTDEEGSISYNKRLSINRSKVPLTFLEKQDSSFLLSLEAEGKGIDPNQKHSKAEKRRTTIRFICVGE